MRRPMLIFLIALVVVLLYALHSVSTLLSLLIEDASRDAILRSEIPAPNSSLLDTRPKLIPKIIHQTYINETIPKAWVPAQQACIDLHPDYEYIMWTDAKSLAFIQKEYPQFLDTFVGYKHPIQRADAIRYFVLYHYGGIYIDLDDGCKRRLDPLLSYTAWVRRTIPTGISNDIMGAVPQHPFFLRVIDSLQGANRKWVLPYITIMASTGPLFLSVIWKNWLSEHNSEEIEWPGRVRVLMPDAYSKQSWSFFTTYKGDSWHGKDARFIFWMGKNWLLVTAIGFAIGGTLALILWFAYNRVVTMTHRRQKSGNPRAVHRGPTQPFWIRWNAGSKQAHEYELVESHDA